MMAILKYKNKTRFVPPPARAGSAAAAAAAAGYGDHLVRLNKE